MPQKIILKKVLKTFGCINKDTVSLNHRKNETHTSIITQTSTIMKHVTSESTFKTEIEAVENVLANQVSKMNPINGRFPVCVKTQISPRVINYGMQFWTIDEIGTGHVENTDGTISILV